MAKVRVAIAESGKASGDRRHEGDDLREERGSGTSGPKSRAAVVRPHKAESEAEE